MRATANPGRGSVLAATLTLLVLLAPAAVASANTGPADSAIKDEIQRHLAVDPATMLGRYQVEVHEGIASLRATVGTVYRERRAVAIAQNVRGVRGVVDRISVHRYRRSPRAVKRDVEDTLLVAPSIESFRVISQVDPGGRVTLTGTVDSYVQRDLAQALVLDVEGVTAVDNNLGVEVAFRRPDNAIEQDVESALAADLKVDAETIDVAVIDGQVQLSGTAGTVMERVQAEQDARVMGVRSVDSSGLKVDRWVRDRLRREVEPLPGDRQIRRAIEDAWTLDPRVKPFRMAARVEGGLAVLVGSALDPAERRAAESDAADAVGTVAVVNRLTLTARAARDRQLEARVHAALRREPLLHDHQLQLFAIDGDVYLTGTTTSRYLRQLAGEVAAGTRGVHRVSNDIDVMAPPLTASDAELTRAVEQQLFWSPYLDDRSITVHADHGEVTLRGSVDGWFELREAGREARAAGARAVHNLLAVKGWTLAATSNRRRR